MTGLVAAVAVALPALAVAASDELADLLLAGGANTTPASSPGFSPSPSGAAGPAATPAPVAIRPRATSADAPVTIEVRTYVNSRTGARTKAFSGRIASGAAGELVELLARECGTRFDRLVHGTRTRAGGVWEMEIPPSDPSGVYAYPGPIGSGAAYRARWNRRYSERIVVRYPLPVWVAKTGSNRYLATVSTLDAMQDVRRRFVELQRLAGGRWVRVRQARLRRIPASERVQPYTFGATFVVRTRGLTLRVLAPVRTTRPCYDAGVSETFRS